MSSPDHLEPRRWDRPHEHSRERIQRTNVPDPPDYSLRPFDYLIFAGIVMAAVGLVVAGLSFF